MRRPSRPRRAFSQLSRSIRSTTSRRSFAGSWIPFCAFRKRRRASQACGRVRRRVPVVRLQLVAVTREERRPVEAFRDDRRTRERRLRLLVGHLEEEQVGELLQVVAVRSRRRGGRCSSSTPLDESVLRAHTRPHVSLCLKVFDIVFNSFRLKRTCCSPRPRSTIRSTRSSSRSTAPKDIERRLAAPRRWCRVIAPPHLRPRRCKARHDRRLQRKSRRRCSQ